MERLLIASACTLGIHPALATQNRKFIVKLKAQSQVHPFLRPFVNDNALRGLADKIQTKSNLKARALHHVNALLAEGSKEEISQAVAGDTSVAYIEEDREIRLAESTNYGAMPANSPYLNVLGLDAANPSASVTKSPGSPAVLVAVIDTGINTQHPFLTPFLSINSGEDLNSNGIVDPSDQNGIDDDGNGYIDDLYGASSIDGNGDVEDVYDHGTHVAGLVKVVRDQAYARSATEPEYEAARNVQVLPIRFFYDCGSGSICGTTSGAILALDYAMSRGAKVVNMSWGSEGTSGYSQALYETLVDLYNHDISLVAAAGNESSNTDSTPFFPASLNSSIPGLISVNSITTWHYSNGDLEEITLSSFSNYGKTTVDVAAPGSSYYLYGGLLSANASYPDSSSFKFIPKSGTSMAAPIVAGIAGVMRALNPDLNAYDVKQIILENAEVPRSPGGSKILGNKNRSEGYVLPLASFEDSMSSEGSGILPATSKPSYSSFRGGNSSGGAGGCGAISHPGSGGGNPFGGNSMGLMTALYFISRIVVHFRRRMRYIFSRC